MLCLKCGEALKTRTTEFNGEYAGVPVSVQMKGLVCDVCGYRTVPGPRMEEFGRLVADEYRTRKGLLTSQDIRNTRKNLGMSQQQFADHLGVGVASVKRWELGKVQEQSMDQLIRLKSSVDAATKNLDELVRKGNSSRSSVEQAEDLTQTVAESVSRYGSRGGTRGCPSPVGAVTYGTWTTGFESVPTTGNEVREKHEDGRPGRRISPSGAGGRNVIVIRQGGEALKGAAELHENASLEGLRLARATFSGAPVSEQQNKIISITFRFASKTKAAPPDRVRLTVNLGIRGIPTDEKDSTDPGARPAFLLDCTYELDYLLREGFKPTKSQVKAFREARALLGVWPDFSLYLQDTLARMAWPPLTAPLLRIEPQMMSEMMSESGRQ